MRPRALLVAAFALVACASGPDAGKGDAGASQGTEQRPVEQGFEPSASGVATTSSGSETNVVLTAKHVFDDRMPAPETATEHLPTPWPFDVTHYSIELTVLPHCQEIRGEVAIDVTDREDGLGELPLDAVDFEIQSVRQSVGDDAAARGAEYSYDGKKLRVPLDAPRSVGTRRTIVVAYVGRPNRGMFFNGGRPEQVYTQGEAEDSRHWFPCHDAPDDRATHRITVHAPETWTTTAAGELETTSPLFAKRYARGTATFSMTTPHVAYLTTLVTGDYRVVESEGVVPLEFVVAERDAPYAAHSLRKTDAVLRFLGDYTGLPYPYPKYAQVCVRNFMFGGMENISATTLTDHTIHPPEWEPARTSTSLVAHEAAHQWFGNWITCSHWSHCWLNEGFATYFDLLFTEHDEGEDEFLWRLRGDREGALGAMDHERRAVVSGKYVRPMDNFDGHAYAGGAMRLHMLRHHLGDRTFRGAIQHYVKTCGLQCVTTDDFQKAVEDYSGQDLAWFFDQWFRKPGYPALKVRWKWDEAKKVVALTVEQTQKTDGGAPEAYRLGLDVAFDPHHLPLTQRRVEIAKRSETFEFPLERAPECVRIDPKSALLARFDLERVIDQLAESAVADHNPAVRHDAGLALEKIVKDEKRPAGDRDKAHAALMEAFRREVFAPLRAALVGQIASRKDDATAQVLIAALNADGDLRVRIAAAAAIDGFKDSVPAREALARLRHDSNDLVRAAAVAGLAKLKAPDAFDVLLQAVERPGWQSVARVAALRGFADLGDQRAFETLVRFAKPGEDDWSRGAAIDSLGRMGKKRPEYRDAVLPYLDDAERGVRREAAEALGKIADPDVLPILHQRFQTETWPACREALRNAVKACRAAAVEEQKLFSAESLRGAQLRDRHAALRDEAEALEKSLAALAGDAKTEAETRLKSLKDQMGGLQHELGEIGVPVKPSPKK
jgi:aminopeptidase N